MTEQIMNDEVVVLANRAVEAARASGLDLLPRDLRRDQAGC